MPLQHPSPPPFVFFAILPGIIFIPALVFFLFFAYNAVKRRLRMFSALATMFGAFLLQQFFVGAQIMLPLVGVNDPTVLETCVGVATIFFVVTLCCLLLALEVFEKDTPLSGRVIFFTALVAAIIGATMSNPSYVSEQTDTAILLHFSPDNTVRILLLLFNTLAASWFLVVFIRSWRAAKVRAQKHLIVWMMVGISLIFSMTSLGWELPPVLVGQPNLLGGFSPYMVGSFFEFIGAIGMCLVGIAFYRISRFPWLMQRQKVHILIVFAGQGIDLYSKIFREDIFPSAVTLLTGAFSAVSSLFDEAAGISGGVQYIAFQGKALRLLKRKDFTCALLVDYTTQASNLALAKFAEEFESKFGAQVRKFNGDLSQFADADAIAQKYFS